MLRRPIPSLFVAALAAGGCAAGDARREPASVQAAASATRSGEGTNLYDLPGMRAARLHRERGADALEAAYAAKDPIHRENAFRTSWERLRLAQDAYHRALMEAPARFRPVIENEIAQVAEYMRQIQRDRTTLRLP